MAGELVRYLPNFITENQTKRTNDFKSSVQTVTHLPMRGSSAYQATCLIRGLATELVLGVPSGGVSDSGGTEHQLGEK